MYHDVVSGRTWPPIMGSPKETDGEINVIETILENYPPVQIV